MITPIKDKIVEIMKKDLISHSGTIHYPPYVDIESIEDAADAILDSLEAVVDEGETYKALVKIDGGCACAYWEDIAKALSQSNIAKIQVKGE